MPPDDTFVDEPVTPAPVFAYRALKGFFFGSPEDQRDVDDSDKENAPLDKPEISKKAKASVKAAIDTTEKSKTSKVSVSMPITFNTPEAKRWDGRLLAPELPPAPGSPTRSILRLPGQATPRSQSLRDVNVTFKDLSPEEATAVRQAKASNDLPAPCTAQPALQDVAAPTQKEKRSRNVVSIDGAATATGSNAGPEPGPPTAGNSVPSGQAPCGGISAEAFEAYQKRTEKEMKRLLAHAKKMKEFAYQADLQNHELRKTIRQLQVQNETFRKGLPALDQEGIAGPNGAFQLPLATRLEELRVAREQRTITRCAPGRVPLCAPPLPEGIDPNSNLARKYKSFENFLSEDPSRGGFPPEASIEQIVEAWRRREKVDLDEMYREGLAIAEAEEDSEFKKRITHPKVYAINKARAAAARERLAKKSEARKASLEI
ncbi:uncharacterized protein A1O9_03042 [Exophiala aquamarina CBS 119918]|uniref:Uncharacterized protein n=1 Tax=Exophiala aquamarina CBS 119918 TaxID=1182545 RepID=A0A072PNK7_9EURO|nr:uncharacterized protein A1O9_03042 [Exophiala aquamarina CBS 119918]KEF61476.1 hypothetical protein A1O9_03042 [Exophiala aquamarina CBS 119918]